MFLSWTTIGIVVVAWVLSLWGVYVYGIGIGQADPLMRAEDFRSK